MDSVNNVSLDDCFAYVCLVYFNVFSFTTWKLYTRTISKAHLLNVAKAWLCKYDNTFYAQHNVPAMDSRLTSFFDVIFCILETYKFPTYLFNTFHFNNNITHTFHTHHLPIFSYHHSFLFPYHKPHHDHRDMHVTHNNYNTCCKYDDLSYI